MHFEQEKLYQISSDVQQASWLQYTLRVIILEKKKSFRKKSYDSN